MNSLRPKFIENSELYVKHSSTLRAIGEFKGRQDIYLKLETEAMETLKYLALIESTESSNRLEGIVTTHKRIVDIILKSSTPRNRSEQEITGYRDALAYIHETWKTMEMNIHTIKLLHSMIYKFLPPIVAPVRWALSINVFAGLFLGGIGGILTFPMESTLFLILFITSCIGFISIRQDGGRIKKSTIRASIGAFTCILMIFFIFLESIITLLYVIILVPYLMVPPGTCFSYSKLSFL